MLYFLFCFLLHIFDLTNDWTALWKLFIAKAVVFYGTEITCLNLFTCKVSPEYVSHFRRFFISLNALFLYFPFIYLFIFLFFWFEFDLCKLYFKLCFDIAFNWTNWFLVYFTKFILYTYVCMYIRTLNLIWYRKLVNL